MASKLTNLFNRSSALLTGKDLVDHQKVWQNKWRRQLKGRVENKFLFILSPPFCGSTLLNQVISTSNFVSVNNERDTREGQTLPEVRKFMFDHHRRWDETLDFDWAMIKKTWLKYWDLTKPVLLEKSPPNILRARSIQQVFSPSYFIIFHRNPYAHCESLIRRKNPDLYQAAQFAIKCLMHQKLNVENLKNHVQISYEELTDNPQKAILELRKLLPELTDIDTDKDFTAHNFKARSMKITNLNNEKIKNLQAGEIELINSVFSEHTDILDFFGYRLIRPA